MTILETRPNKMIQKPMMSRIGTTLVFIANFPFQESEEMLVSERIGPFCREICES